MERIEKIAVLAKEIEEEVNQHLIGQEKLVRETVICLLAGGNLLIEGVPGLGKTRLVHTLGKVLGLAFKRIQFTPDLMPADITGTNIYNKDQGTFEFEAGPIFAGVILADEINRATPKTQAAMLEAMQEKTVTVGGHTYPLPKPYMVMATQNPIEQEGTYPLPEAQMDRFMFKLHVQFPQADVLAKIVELTTSEEEKSIQVVTQADALLEAINGVKAVPVASSVLNYAMALIVATHKTEASSTEMIKKYVNQGASPRGAQGIIMAARVKALMSGRYNVAFEDVAAMAYPVLRHRLLLNFEAVSEGITAETIIEDLLEKIKK